MQCLVHAFVLHFVCWPHWVSEEAEPVSEEAEPRRKRQQAIRADVCMHNGDRVHKGIDTYRHNINNLIDTLYSRAASPWCLLHGKISWHMVLQISFAIWQPMLVSMILNSDAVCVYIYAIKPTIEVIASPCLSWLAACLHHMFWCPWCVPASCNFFFITHSQSHPSDVVSFEPCTNICH